MNTQIQSDDKQVLFKKFQFYFTFSKVKITKFDGIHELYHILLIVGLDLALNLLTKRKQNKAS